MGDKNMSIVFSSGISNLAELNSSFDSGILRVAYTGRNRNNSFISKETFERCMPSIYNCPIVCNYDRATDTIGSHDMELVSDTNGMRIVNITHPVGVVPESAKYWWEEIEDASGLHEYLCVDVLIWKRQEAYRKIKEDGITDESMEISVKEGCMRDGVYVIDRFEFTAFCLLGTAEPCYESASLEMFSRDNFKQQFADMMQEFKESFSLVSPSTGVEDTHKDSTEGGEEVLEHKLNLLAKYGLSESDVEFDIASMSYEDLMAELKKTKGAIDDDDDDVNNEPPADEADDVEEQPDDGDDAQADGNESFTLLGEQFHNELIEALSSETVETCFGEMARYCYVDYNMESCEVYCYDMEDWKLYGFKYSMNGDNVIVDFETKQRKKFSIVDFDNGDQVATFASVFETATKRFAANDAQWVEKYQTASDMISSMENELDTLRKFKADTEKDIEKDKRNEIFARFEDLIGIEAFDELQKNSAEYSIDVLEEKCYAIRGKHGVVAKFSHEPKAPKLPVVKTEPVAEPYGGAFVEYGIF